jgi:hypothetical protein
VEYLFTLNFSVSRLRPLRGRCVGQLDGGVGDVGMVRKLLFVAIVTATVHSAELQVALEGLCGLTSVTALVLCKLAVTYSTQLFKYDLTPSKFRGLKTPISIRIGSFFARSQYLHPSVVLCERRVGLRR